MPFFNQPSLILQDHLGNLYNFIYNNQSISYYAFDKQLGKIEKRVIINQVTADFDGDINYAGEIYLVCKKNNGSIVLLSNHKSFSKEEVIIDSNNYTILNLNISLIGEKIHIFYCLASNESQDVYKIYHHFGNGESWVTNEVCTITAGQILNPLEIVKEKEKIILGYYDLVEGVEQLFVKGFNLREHSWSPGEQLTTSEESKLYLDMLITEEKHLNIVYSEYSQGNLVVKYEKFNIEQNAYKKILEKELSNPANCLYPTLIYYDNRLWVSWSEYNYVASRYLEDGDTTWSDLYLWKESKREDIIRHKYIASKQEKQQGYALNYSFGKITNLSFIGFGNLDNTSIIPLKKKGMENVMTAQENQETKKDHEDKQCQCTSSYEETINELREDLNKINKQIEGATDIERLVEKVDRIQKRIKDIGSIEERARRLENWVEDLERKQKKRESIEGAAIKELEEHIVNIENFLTQKTRTFRRDKKF